MPEYTNRDEGDEDVDLDHIVSNPIHIYNLIKEMLNYNENVYHPLLKVFEDIG